MVINFIDSTETIKGALFKEEAVKSWLDTLIRVFLPLWVTSKKLYWVSDYDF